ncbi:hypothetical protein ACK3ZC_06960 [Aeromonas caviae]
MEPEMRKRYEVVRVKDLVDFFAAQGVKPHCPQCKSTYFTFQVLSNATPDLKDDSQEQKLEVFEWQGIESTWAFYPLSCQHCASFFNVDAEKILEWTEMKQVKSAELATQSGEGTEPEV